MKELGIDIETYCAVDITTAGAYRYIQDPTFEVLTVAWAFGEDKPSQVDLTNGEALPPAFWDWLTDPAIIKRAYNATFEWYAFSLVLSRLTGKPALLPIEQWRDTMLRAAYSGLPLSLDAAGKALGLDSDTRKMAEGKALIRYFCRPCAPSKTNGGRTRNLPKHDPEKWALFCEYNRRDVVAERAIDRRLSTIEIPEKVQQQWQEDALLNARGVAVDLDLIRGAIALAAKEQTALLDEARQLTGLDNPNSVAALSGFVGLPNLQKATVEKAMQGDLPIVHRRLLEIRQEIGKTSNSKYDAMLDTVCGDGRIRGLLQFYGSRTGRWAGRLVQVQNLPRTYIKPDLLPLARRLVKQQNADGLRVLFGSVNDTLSQLIRTAFVPAPGCVYIDADFSAIEARVISWLAGEGWRLEVFATHGKIYEASASQMFGVPIELITKGRPEYALRQKGKVAELALGYQGGKGALINMGALDMGIPEADLPEIVDKWRKANGKIVQLWADVGTAAMKAVDGHPTTTHGLTFRRRVDASSGLDFMSVDLPSGRQLIYQRPMIEEDAYGRPRLSYMGVNQTTRKYCRLDTYGGKLVENIVQAIARDCLAEKLTALQTGVSPFTAVFHIHDEVVLEVDKSLGATLEDITTRMAEPIPWAPGLPLAADGWVGDFFRKD